ncbi:hypothetical protein FB107DRAFT_276260 [Schizophyllum commune]
MSQPQLGDAMQSQGQRLFFHANTVKRSKEQVTNLEAHCGFTGDIDMAKLDIEPQHDDDGYENQDKHQAFGTKYPFNTLDGLQAPSTFSEAAQRHSDRGPSMILRRHLAKDFGFNVRRLTDISMRFGLLGFGRPPTIQPFDCDSSTNSPRCHVRASITTSSPTNTVMGGSMTRSTSSHTFKLSQQWQCVLLLGYANLGVDSTPSACGARLRFKIATDLKFIKSARAKTTGS